MKKFIGLVCIMTVSVLCAADGNNQTPPRPLRVPVAPGAPVRNNILQRNNAVVVGGVPMPRARRVLAAVPTVQRTSQAEQNATFDDLLSHRPAGDE